MALAFTATLVAAPVWPQQAQSSSKPQSPSSTKDAKSTSSQDPKDQGPDLPVSLNKIKEALQQAPAQPLRGLDERPHFKLEIQERRKISLDDLIKSLDFKSGPTPAGGLYGFEQQRQMWNPVDHPMRQPYAAFNQPQLLTILIENLVGKYLANRAMSAITSADRAGAEAAARDEVRRAIGEYCEAQPNRGAGIQICSDSIR